MRCTVVLTLPLSVALTLARTQSADARVAPAAQMAARIDAALLTQEEPSTRSDDRAVVTRGPKVRSTYHGREFSLRLPGLADSGYDTGGLQLNTTSGRGFRTAVQETGEGSFRALVYLENAGAPRGYRFDLGGALRPSLLPDGGVLVRDRSGKLLGTFAPPWATDAAGVSVNTRYRIDGSTVTQVIDVTRSTRFPVVADPWWIPVIIMVRVMFGIMTRHAARQAAARGVSHQVVRRVIKDGKATRGNGNTTIFSQGSGRSRVRVVVDNRSGNVITVTKG